MPHLKIIVFASPMFAFAKVSSDEFEAFCDKVYHVSGNPLTCSDASAFYEKWGKPAKQMLI